jgi:hypothetical protein
LVAACPDKVHISIHFPELESEVNRAIDRVKNLENSGIPSGIDLLVAKSNLVAADRAAKKLIESGSIVSFFYP